MFILVMAKILNAIYAQLHEDSLITTLPWVPSDLVSQDEITSIKNSAECSYIDDLAFWLMYPTRQNSLLIDRVIAVMKVIANNFHIHLFKANFKAGKTEIAIAVKGRNSSKVLTALGPAGSRQLPVDTLYGQINVKMIRIYKHLGDMVDIRGSLKPKISRNITLGISAFSDNKSFLTSTSLTPRYRVIAHQC